MSLVEKILEDFCITDQMSEMMYPIPLRFVLFMRFMALFISFLSSFSFLLMLVILLILAIHPIPPHHPRPSLFALTLVIASSSILILVIAPIFLPHTRLHRLRRSPVLP